MALWTDPSRQFLINSIRNRQILWDKNFTSDQNFRAVKNSALIEVTSELNNMFPMSTKFTVDDVRSQWKNLKDTFVRKLRWVTEGKYSEDPTKEPTWKFYRMLSFLDDKEAKRLGNDGGDYDLVTTSHPDMQTIHMKNDVPMHYDHSNHSSASSEERMLQMFSPSYEKPMAQQQQQQHTISPPSPSLPMPVSSAPCSTETICAKPPYTPPAHMAPTSSNHMDDDDEPRRKRPYQRRMNGCQDEFDLFGACVAAQLKRICDDGSRAEALKLQKQLSDVLYAHQIEMFAHH